MSHNFCPIRSNNSNELIGQWIWDALYDRHWPTYGRHPSLGFHLRSFIGIFFHQVPRCRELLPWVNLCRSEHQSSKIPRNGHHFVQGLFSPKAFSAHWIWTFLRSPFQQYNDIECIIKKEDCETDLILWHSFTIF